MAANNQDFVTYQGNVSKPIFTVLTGEGGDVVDISSCTEITWLCRRSETDSVALTLSKTGGQIAFVTDGTDGKFQVSISAINTAALSGYYLHYATVTDGNNNPTTVAVGRMQVGIKPTWTYDPNQTATNPLYQVRRLVGDVLPGDEQMSDAEIQFAIDSYPNIWQAAGECCRMLAAQYARLVDTIQGELRTLYGQKAKNYMAMAYQYDQKGLTMGAVVGFAGGISIATKIAQENDSDRVAPQFNIGMNDNLIPVGPVGNETPTSPPSIGGAVLDE